MILKTHKNTLFKIIEDNSLNHDMFDISEDDFIDDEDNRKVNSFKIMLKGSDLYFEIIQSEMSFNTFYINKSYFVPGFETDREKVWKNIYESNEMYEIFDAWLIDHVMSFIYENGINDKWLSIKKSIDPINFNNINFEDSSEFNYEEKEIIKIGLNEVKLLINEKFEFNADQLELIERRLNYLGEAVNRLSKTDWKGIAISTIIGLILNLAVDVETGQAILDLFKKLFDKIPQLPF